MPWKLKITVAAWIYRATERLRLQGGRRSVQEFAWCLRIMRQQYHYQVPKWVSAHPNG
jgi:hypothetical protein